MHKTKERALAALLEHPTHEGAAKAAGISARTLRRYLQDDEFRDEYEKRCALIITEASNRLMRTTGAAIDALLQVSQDANGPPYARVSAARALLDANLRYSESKSMKAAARAADVPVFIYNPRELDEPPIPPERYAEVERLLNEPPVIYLGVEPKRCDEHGREEGNEQEGQEEQEG